LGDAHGLGSAPAARLTWGAWGQRQIHDVREYPNHVA